ILPEDLPDRENTRKILWVAIGLEKASIIFYLGMKELVPESLGKKKIDDIMKEEMGHIRLLSNRLLRNHQI
ncbi:MAG: hypothetical protein KAU41_01990, partial [Deltaproteobacteria bacterium]|nr:hypothetical protein [Deltaproteobacteria bacterium]